VLLDTGANQLALFAGHAPKPVRGLRADTTTQSVRPLLLTMGDVARSLDGLRGPTALGITRIEFDWEHQCLRWDTE
jgi:hypothetical protein